MQIQQAFATLADSRGGLGIAQWNKLLGFLFRRESGGFALLARCIMCTMPCADFCIAISSI